MSKLPRKFSKPTPLNVGMADLSLLLEVYYFLSDELLESLDGPAIAICNQKLTEIRAVIEVQIFGKQLSTNNSIEISGDKPEDIDLSKFDEGK